MSLLAILALAEAAVSGAPATYDGRCMYPAVLGDPRPGEVRLSCSQVDTDDEGIDFVDREWNSRMMRFAGIWDGDLLKVRSVTPRTGATLEARGVCRVDHTNGAVSVIACTAVAGGLSWIGNFRVSKI
ncbi:hypothetical protein GRI89_10230 [Altererythrobacter salegens]|uniref:Uncharacterized protein n=1 Tax=Croceibacterium salegens TaxID=1737568 RepID=A0A6I4SYQ9_9SPHN|nr:hypothetical protein [Croceibacterium salegens]MXO59916.1 hypothetical protein [Croceibacterium salegens]